MAFKARNQWEKGTWDHTPSVHPGIVRDPVERLATMQVLYKM